MYSYSYRRLVMNSVNKLRSLFGDAAGSGGQKGQGSSEMCQGQSQEEGGYRGKVPIHRLTAHPTKAWETLKVKQTVSVLDPTPPSTPISDDKLRFVCISDTHCQIEALGTDFVPDGDVLLHAGDFTQIGAVKSVQKFNQYLGTLPHKVKVVIAGNHDMSLDLDMVTNQRRRLLQDFNLQPNQLEDALKDLGVSSCRDLLTNCVYLLDSGIDLCGVKVYGSPWQPEFCGWGFNLPRGTECLKKWDMIPDDTDVLITHGPPIGYGDKCYDGCRAGCVELLTTVQSRVKPSFHVFGHIHEAYGVTSDGVTTFINASTCSLRYKPTNPPVIFDVLIPLGHSKQELLSLPVNNIISHPAGPSDQDDS